MPLSRRAFLEHCARAAGALGLSGSALSALGAQLAEGGAPPVVWLQGAACSGCTVSFLDHVSTYEPQTAVEVLTESASLLYHPTLMAAAGGSAVEALESAYADGGYVLVVEGGVPTAFGGQTCVAWSDASGDVTFQDGLRRTAEKATQVLCAGTCASWGGVPAAGANPAGIVSVSEALGRDTVNVGGCPPHPSWIVWALVQMLLGKPMDLDAFGRPSYLYNREQCEDCPREHGPGGGGALRCLEREGCHGEGTYARCSGQLFNSATNWCVGVNSPCLGCVNPAFPGETTVLAQRGGGRRFGGGRGGR